MNIPARLLLLLIRFFQYATCPMLPRHPSLGKAPRPQPPRRRLDSSAS